MVSVLIQARLRFVVNPSRNSVLSSQIHKHFQSTKATKLVFSKNGDPVEVVRLENDKVPEPRENQVLLKMLASPVNPVDINIIQGKYPLKLSFPSVLGTEGVASVLKVGSGVSDFKPGDHVVPLIDLGTWRTHFNAPQECLLKVPNSLGLAEAATLTINPCTAYRMLKDYANLKPGDCVIQNGANSACGQNVIQICNSWGIKTVNIVRPRPNLDELKEYLKNLGGNYVFTEEELQSSDIFKSGTIDRPKLALDCIGGSSAIAILKALQSDCTMVTYGGMSRQPIAVPVPLLIFKDICIRGFRINDWTRKNEKSTQRAQMFDELITLMTKNYLKGPVHQMVDLLNFKEALANTMAPQGMAGKKFILDFCI